MPLWSGRKRKRKRGGVLACMECGSGDIVKMTLIDGPVVYEHRTSDTVHCRECGHDGIPIVLSDEGERLAYARAIRGERR